MPNALTYPSHIGYRHQWSPLLLFLITAARVCCFLGELGRSIADKVCMVTILLPDSSKMVKFRWLSCCSWSLWPCRRVISPNLSSCGSDDGTSTEAFSQNFSKLFSKLKLVTDNLLSIYAEANLKATESTVAFLTIVQQRRGPKMWPHCSQHPEHILPCLPEFFCCTVQLQWW